MFKKIFLSIIFLNMFMASVWAADFTITLPNKAVIKLQKIVTKYNENMGTNLTVQEWIILTIKNVAIAQEFNAEVSILQQQYEQKIQNDLNTALEAKRQELLLNLEK